MSVGHTEGRWKAIPWHIEEGPPAVRCRGGHVVCTTASDDDARLISAACNSYDRQCGERAIEAAEADLLGKALEALRTIVTYAPDIGVDQFLDGLSDARRILSQAREVK